MFVIIIRKLDGVFNITAKVGDIIFLKKQDAMLLIEKGFASSNVDKRFLRNTKHVKKYRVS